MQLKHSSTAWSNSHVIFDTPTDGQSSKIAIPAKSMQSAFVFTAPGLVWSRSTKMLSPLSLSISNNSAALSWQPPCLCDSAHTHSHL